jgi:outer membrane protein OmpA-like peptidoglycan-associated protein
MKKAIVFLGVVILLLAACDPQTRTRSGGPSGVAGEAKERAEGVGAAAEGTGRMMENQERDLRQALAGFKAVTVQRQGGFLDLVLRWDACFSGDSDTIQQDVYAIFDRIAQGLQQYPRTLIRVEGYTDSQGTDSHNMALSYQQALAVKAALTQRGVEDSRIQVQAFGRAEPVAPSDTEAGRSLNQRVVVKVVPVDADSY